MLVGDALFKDAAEASRHQLLGEGGKGSQRGEDYEEEIAY